MQITLLATFTNLQHCDLLSCSTETVTSQGTIRYCYNRYINLNILLGAKIIHLIDRTELFKISNLVLGGKAIVTSLYRV